MAYTLSFLPPVQSYIRTYQGLTRSGRIRLFSNIDADLRHNADFYMNDVAYRLNDSPLHFWYSLVLQDPIPNGPFFSFTFVVNASGAPYGVLEVEYVDEGGPGPGMIP